MAIRQTTLALPATTGKRSLPPPHRHPRPARRVRQRPRRAPARCGKKRKFRTTRIRESITPARPGKLLQNLQLTRSRPCKPHPRFAAGLIPGRCLGDFQGVGHAGRSLRQPGASILAGPVSLRGLIAVFYLVSARLLRKDLRRGDSEVAEKTRISTLGGPGSPSRMHLV